VKRVYLMAIHTGARESGGSCRGRKRLGYKGRAKTEVFRVLWGKKSSATIGVRGGLKQKEGEAKRLGIEKHNNKIK